MKALRLFLVAVLAMLALAHPAWADDAKPFKPDELEQLVAPIALYPDSLLAQVMMASTYPLEIVEAERWVKNNPNLKDKALDDALQSQSWDASVKSLAAFPQVLQMMNDKLDWTQRLGDAVLAQQADVMSAVQRLRTKAQAEGNLKSSKEQTVTVVQATAQQPQVITIEPAQPQVVYVPTYNPTVVYGPWPYPAYQPFYWYPPGYTAAASFFSFTAGVAVGAALWGNFDWHHDDININVNRYNDFNRNVNRNFNNVNNNVRNNNWQHDPGHRGGVQYRDNATQQRFAHGGRGNANTAQNRDAFRGRADAQRQNLGNVDRGTLQQRDGNQARQAGNLDRGQNRQSGNLDRGQGRDAQQQRANTNRPAQQHTGNLDRQNPNRGATPQRQAQPRENAFQGVDRGGSASRAAASRGASSRANIQRPAGGGGGFHRR
ncbi:hypothetical protein GCM10007860_16310 [Chitiniphilus shinanonensis]|uniref:DUF3300 domain-containing protein n=1 Tax=Chitiniphilus shinanonensis TaxID=553088 RepID=A0ABQ6BS78_9NEIS|nr:DUF3300 domain-containing protein [Chitiniphilus shinanonensis]GLS04484.1 hypothetical protein GCM10007860_16310 [Chitiniphilus shinanonensis]